MSRASLQRVLVVALFAAALFARRADAVITLDATFDSGSVCLSPAPASACDDSGVYSTVSGNNVTLTGRDNFNGGTWKWLYFRANDVNGQQVMFQIGEDFATGANSLNDHRMMYSYDQVNWEFFDNNGRSGGAFHFSNNAAFNQNSVYVAYGQPYSYQRVVDHTNSIAASPWVSSTVSGNSSLIVGQSPGGTDDIGRTITPKNLYGYKITDEDFAGPKQKIVLVSGVHSNETLGNHTLEGLVDFLLSDELAAAQLRRYAEFYVYPMANPDGRFAGYNRSTVQRRDVDPNRAWNPPTYIDPDDPSLTLSDIQTIGEAIRDDTNEDVDYLIDFHSTVNPAVPYHHGLILPAWQSDPFWVALQGLEPQVLTENAALVDFTGAKFGRDVLNAEFSATFETVFPVNETVDRYLDLGHNFGLAWHDVFYVPADLNFDGIVDSDDWTVFIAGSESDMDLLSPIERYDLGDLDGDGDNSFDDFEAFKELFDAANGEGAFAAMLAGVPEPSSMALVLLIGVFLTTTRHRNTRSSFALLKRSCGRPLRGRVRFQREGLIGVGDASHIKQTMFSTEQNCFYLTRRQTLESKG
jgi:hypothetical protein